MCGRIIQSSGPLHYAFVDGMNVRDTRVHNYPPRWNAAPSQDLLVIRRNRQTSEISLDPSRWGLVPDWCKDPSGGRKPINAKSETVPNLPTFRDAYRLRRKRPRPHLALGSRARVARWCVPPSPRRSYAGASNAMTSARGRV
jgi:putative SOS response-associated peptidase YedK